eukprot:XP_001707568.1 Hypothetical protein GL50803_6529 [Giardia lamblia ATCC 50803]
MRAIHNPSFSDVLQASAALAAVTPSAHQDFFLSG